MTIGERIKARREELGITQEELAKTLGYKSKTSINKIELGHQELTQKKIALCANALDISIEELMGWTEEERFVKFTVPIINSSIDAKQRFGAKMTTKEIRIVEAYRKADNCIQSVVEKLLDVVEEPVLLAAHDNGATLDQIKEDADMI